MSDRLYFTQRAHPPNSPRIQKPKDEESLQVQVIPLLARFKEYLLCGIQLGSLRGERQMPRTNGTDSPSNNGIQTKRGKRGTYSKKLIICSRSSLVKFLSTESPRLEAAMFYCFQFYDVYKGCIRGSEDFVTIKTRS